MKVEKFNEHNFTTFDDDIVYAGKSKYPVGTKIKFKDDGEYLTGTLTHPFGYGDVGVFLDEKGKYKYDRVSLKNNEYTVIDDDVDKFIKDHNFKKDIKKFNL